MVVAVCLVEKAAECRSDQFQMQVAGMKKNRLSVSIEVPRQPFVDTGDAAKVGHGTAVDVRVARLQHARQRRTGSQFERNRHLRFGAGVHAVHPDNFFGQLARQVFDRQRLAVDHTSADARHQRRPGRVEVEAAQQAGERCHGGHHVRRV